MSKYTTHLFIWTIALCIFGFLGWTVYENEAIIAYADPIYLELAPVDPRSLIQGDYMIVNYEIAPRRWSSEEEDWPQRGTLLVTLDDRNKVIEHTFYTDQPIAENQRLLNFYTKNGNITFGSDGFFFQEGTGHLYEDAEYGALKLSAEGRVLDLQLADENLVIIE